MKIDSIKSKNLEENTWIVSDEDEETAVIIDPGAEYSTISEKLNELKLEPKQIINTHLHPDHLISARKLQENFEIPFKVHKDEKPLLDSFNDLKTVVGMNDLSAPVVNEWLSDAQMISMNGSNFKVMHTPGHSPGSICLLLNKKHLFSGDTLFSGSIGRVDLPYGSKKDIMKSLRRIKKLPIKTIIYPGHGPQSSMEKELNINPYL